MDFDNGSCRPLQLSEIGMGVIRAWGRNTCTFNAFSRNPYLKEPLKNRA